MDGVTPTLSTIRGRTLESSTLHVTPRSLDRNKDQISNIFSGFAGFLAILLVVAVFCILWNWNKRKKRQVPYLRVTVMPLLTLPQNRQRAKNIYDILPWRQEDLGRHESRSMRIFSTESLLSRNSESPEHVPSQAGNAFQEHRAHVHAVEYAVGIYDNAMVPQMCDSLTPSARCINVRASRDCTSISSEDSHEYVNVPTAEEIAETLASTKSPSRNLFVLPSAQKLEFTEERDEGCADAGDCTSLYSPETEGSDSLSNGEGSSQTSNDYVNMTGLDLGAIQERQLWVTFQCCRDYENVPAADPSGRQQQAEKDVPSSNIGHVEDKTDDSGTHVRCVKRTSLASGDYADFQPFTQSENSQMKHREEMSNEDSNDYENVLTAQLGGRDSEQGPGTQLLPDE
ncbi:lymphocyte transmembrane adapter 1 isoform X1 [Macaca nemestrina]|uniref:Lymphocyte transmembrane adaptor 1 n=1 Tax=Macaca nemestrina TaxID=9545 RepID=A0A2K6CL47_MACNE|nr:lymphocyte transmembrane adapter 1 isoform X1 [Macaca nemestrina]XP_011745020.1 lymphocyte transmembrane adapter 1 isoform X1 [Macaca nemestrina]